jgi:glycogen debranching enzyme
MDNTPRGVDHYSFFWVDAISQMALSALYIARLAQEIGRKDISDEYMAKYREKCQLINDLYFDETDGSYYDIAVATPHHIKVLTPASFWPLMAEAAPEERAARQIKTLLDPMKLGGKVALPSVSRDDPAFCSDGRYWKGAVWLPTSYMVTKALEKYGRFDLAADVAYSTVNHMAKTCDNFFPQTIWECYSPTSYEPAKAKLATKYCRPDFCGWSALGPISLFIENTLGFHHADAVARRIEYHYRPAIGRHGIKNFKFGNITCDIIIENGKLDYKTNNPFTFSIDGKDYLLTGSGSIDLA